MTETIDRRRSRLTAPLLRLGLILSVVAGSYAVAARDPSVTQPQSSPAGRPDRSASETDKREMRSLVTVLIISFLLLLVFLAGSYLIVRAGRRVLRARPEATRYVDAWSHYRVTEQQIDAATAEPDQEHTDTDGSDQDPPEFPPSG